MDSGMSWWLWSKNLKSSPDETWQKQIKHGTLNYLQQLKKWKPLSINKTQISQGENHKPCDNLDKARISALVTVLNENRHL